MEVQKRPKSSSESSSGSRNSPPARNRSPKRSYSNRSSVKAPPKTKCLGVFGLSASTSEDKIYEIFGKYGSIRRINVIFDTKTGRSRGFCFIYYKHLSDAVDAKESCSGMEIDNRRIRVDYSITNRPHEPTPGVYKGKSTRRDNESRSHKRRSRSRSRSRDRSRSRSRS